MYGLVLGSIATVQVSECVLDVVFSRAKNGTAERASPTLSWQRP